jgi:hypothetical protein
MTIFQKHFIPALALIAVFLGVIPKAAFAQTDEIQVYDAEIEDQGKFNIMVHSNFTPIGRTTPDFPGAIIPNHSSTERLNGPTASPTGLSRACMCRFTPHTPKGAAGRLTALRYANCSCQNSDASLHCAGHLAEGAGSLTECNYRLLIRELLPN